MGSRQNASIIFLAFEFIVGRGAREGPCFLLDIPRHSRYTMPRRTRYDRPDSGHFPGKDEGYEV